ncbi:hypothetical protein ES708_32953 [subsurface metagenome]
MLLIDQSTFLTSSPVEPDLVWGNDEHIVIMRFIDLIPSLLQGLEELYFLFKNSDDIIDILSINADEFEPVNPRKTIKALAFLLCES